MSTDELLAELAYAKLEVNFTNGDITAVFTFDVDFCEDQGDILFFEDNDGRPLKFKKEGLSIAREDNGFIITYPDENVTKYSTVVVVKIVD